MAVQMNVDQWRMAMGDLAMTNRVLELELEKAQRRVADLEARYEPKEEPSVPTEIPDAAERIKGMKRARNDKLSELADRRIRGTPDVIDAVAAEMVNGKGAG